MPEILIWNCCRCGYGPFNSEIDLFCPACGVERCDFCWVIPEDRPRELLNTNPMALHQAVRENNMDMVLQMLESGVDVNMTGSDSDGKTPLHVAIEYENMVMIEALLERGADVNDPGDFGVTTLMMALRKRLHSSVEAFLQAGALLRGAVQKIVLEHDVSHWSQVEIETNWDVFRFVQSDLSAVEDIRKAITLTGFVKNAQMMSCEDYVAQTWNDSGLKVLDTLIQALKTGYAVSDISDVQMVSFQNVGDVMRITIKASSIQHVVDLMEQLAWLGCVFTCKQTESSHGPILATGHYWFSTTSRCFCLSIQNYSMDGYLDEPCWTNLLRSATLAVGFPVRDRPEGGIGLEIPFPLLLRFADISVSMDYDGGTVLVGSSTILFPSRRLKDGIQWHIADAISAQEAVQVFSRSPDWVRTSDLGQLSRLTAYLGYCSHALVLLGTRDLVMSQRTSELSCRLPSTKSQIEISHEGTLSVGVSIRGIFNATVGGKWNVPSRFDVSLEEDRDIEDRLLNASRRPVLIYDRTKDRGWLVPELCLVVHMALTYLNQPEVRQRCLTSVKEDLPYPTAAADGGSEAYNIVTKYWRLELYQKLEDGKMKTFGMLIRDFMKDLQKLRTAENFRRESQGWRLTLSSGRRLRGWDFSELALKAEKMSQREMEWENSGPMWAMLGNTEDMLVILGSCLGDLVCPDLQKTKVMSCWETVPERAGLLTATCSSVLQLAKKQVLLTVSEMASKPQSGKLFWYRPMVHPDCNQFCNKSCLIIHEIARKNSQTCTEHSLLESCKIKVLLCLVVRVYITGPWSRVRPPNSPS